MLYLTYRAYSRTYKFILNELNEIRYLSSVSFILTKFVAEPGPPTNLTAESKTSESISLRWAAPACDGNSHIANYTVRYKSKSNTTYRLHTTNNTRVNLTGLIPAQTYLIDVAAANFHFIGNFSNQITEVTREGGMF